MSYTKSEAVHLFNRARDYGLSGYRLLSNAETVMTECNGIGADWMPSCMRTLCTKLNKVMEIPAAIHDRRYVLGSTNTDRQSADSEFFTNCSKIIMHEYAWWNPWRYIMLRRAMRYTTYLHVFGSVAWEEAKKK